MTQIEQIKTEIERLKSQLVRGACAAGIAMETNCKEEAYNEVLAIIDSLPAESTSPELEDAARIYVEGIIPLGYDKGDVYGAFIAGAELQKAQIMKKAVKGFISIRGRRSLVAVCDSLNEFRYGDKVKLIILKDND